MRACSKCSGPSLDALPASLRESLHRRKAFGLDTDSGRLRPPLFLSTFVSLKGYRRACFLVLSHLRSPHPATPMLPGPRTDVICLSWTLFTTLPMVFPVG